MVRHELVIHKRIVIFIKIYLVDMYRLKPGFWRCKKYKHYRNSYFIFYNHKYLVISGNYKSWYALNRNQSVLLQS